MAKITCDGKTADDCSECGMNSSSYSLHWCDVRKKKVSEISCGIGGCRTFDEDGDRID